MGTRRSNKAVLAWARFIAAIAASASIAAYALQNEFKNLDDIVKNVGFSDYSNAQSSQVVKIAVLDNGFAGYKEQLGKTLPENLRYHAGPVAVDPKEEEFHGRIMAELVAGLLDQAPGVRYQLDLYSAFGYSNLEAAVHDVIKNKVDIVLYSQVWEYGGNGDGRGFINTLVNQATKAGVIWVNASGNFGDGTFRSPISVGDDDWVKLPGPNSVVRVRCEKTSAGTCPIRIVLSWNDFKDDVNAGTNKDLDLVLTDDTLRIVQSSAYVQMLKVPNPAPPGASLYPRELIETQVPAGEYFLRVKARSHNFNSKKDTLRLTVSGQDIKLEDQTPGETLLPPADNASVITIGANDTPMSSSGARFHKPELVTQSRITLTSGDTYEGSSNSAAIAAAAVALSKGLNPALTKSQAIRELSALMPPDGSGDGSGDDSGDGSDDGSQPPTPTPPPTQGVPSALSLRTLQFGPTGPKGCFKPILLPVLPQPLEPLLQQHFTDIDGNSFGPLIVQSTAGAKIFMPEDPFQIVGRPRTAADDMLIVGMTGYLVMPRIRQRNLPPGYYELVETPLEARVCGQMQPQQPTPPSQPSRPSPRPPARPPAPGSAPSVGAPLHLPGLETIPTRPRR